MFKKIIVTLIYRNRQLMYFYLSIGTNINPEKNAVRIIKNLCHHFGMLTLYPFVYTKPELISSSSIFLNGLAIIESKLDDKELKNILNSIEVKLGRNRNDPLKSTKNRPADIDILLQADKHHLALFDTFTDQYIKACLPPNTPVDLSVYGLPAHQGAATIHLDNTAGQISIIENKFDCLVHREESTFIWQ